MSDSGPMSGGRLWLGVALVLSLAVNTFFVGIGVGRRAHTEGWTHNMHERMTEEHLSGSEVPFGHFPTSFHLDPRHLGRALPEGEARDRAVAIMEVHQDRIRELLDEAGAARFEAIETLRADEFDEDALAEAFAVSRAADDAVAAAVHALVVEMTSSMSPAERAVMEERMGQRMRDHQRRREHFERRRDGAPGGPPFGPRGGGGDRRRDHP